MFENEGQLFGDEGIGGGAGEELAADFERVADDGAGAEVEHETCRRRRSGLDRADFDLDAGQRLAVDLEHLARDACRRDGSAMTLSVTGCVASQAPSLAMTSKSISAELIGRGTKDERAVAFQRARGQVLHVQ